MMRVFSPPLSPTPREYRSDPRGAGDEPSVPNERLRALVNVFYRLFCRGRSLWFFTRFKIFWITLEKKKNKQPRMKTVTGRI